MEVSHMQDTVDKANLLSEEWKQQKKELTEIAEFLVAQMQIKMQTKDFSKTTWHHITVPQGDYPRKNPLTLVVINADAITTSYILDSGFKSYEELSKYSREQ